MSATLRDRELIVLRFARLLLVFSSIAAEMGAADALIGGRTWSALGWHLGSGLLAGAAAAHGCEFRARALRAGFAFVMAISLPGSGVLGLVVTLLSPSHCRESLAPQVVQLSRPDWHDTSAAASEQAARMLAHSRSTGQRVRVLLSQRAMPSTAAVPGLRAGLRDGREEVRLLAHALLDRRETRLRIAIASLEAELERGLSKPPCRHQLLRRLAHLHWAIVEAELAQGELARGALERARGFAEAALAARFDGELCLLVIRAHLRRSDGLNAWRWLQRAERGGVAREARAPLYAEAAFLLRRFEQIPHWLRSCGRQLWRPELRRVAAVWMQVERNSSGGRPTQSRERT
jgi:hypothetical protein